MVATDSEKPAVLVVDDNPLIVNVLKSLLLAENYHVLTCNNGQEALNLLEKKLVDVIVCDVMMPTMDGYQLHTKVREKNELSHIPFIFLTALDDQSEINAGLEAGADDYVVKPFDPRSLLAVVKGKVVRSRTLKQGAEKKYDSYRKKVIHTLSHEFRTPLVAINTGTELLLEQQQALDKKKMMNLLEAIRRGGQRLERLVNDFMLMQQIEAGIATRLYEAKASKRLISETVQFAVEGQKELLDVEKFSVEVVDRAQGVKVHCYEPHIQDILARLIQNSVKFRTDNRLIEIHINVQESEVVIEVRDRGIGMDVNKVKEAIDVFGQIDRERLEQQGGGMGLAIANRYASINKGRLEFDARSGGGTVVSLILPKELTQK